MSRATQRSGKGARTVRARAVASGWNETYLRRRRILGAAVECEVLEHRRLLAGQGLWGEYYSLSNPDGNVPQTRRHDLNVNFEWGSGKIIDGIGNAGAVQWTGYINIPTTGTYTFYADTVMG